MGSSPDRTIYWLNKIIIMKKILAENLFCGNFVRRPTVSSCCPNFHCVLEHVASCLPPTSYFPPAAHLHQHIHNSEAEPRINTSTDRHNRVHMAATLFRLTSILPDETYCLYLQCSTSSTMRTSNKNNGNLFFHPLRDNATGACVYGLKGSDPHLQVKLCQSNKSQSVYA